MNPYQKFAQENYFMLMKMMGRSERIRSFKNMITLIEEKDLHDDYALFLANSAEVSLYRTSRNFGVLEADSLARDLYKISQASSSQAIKDHMHTKLNGYIPPSLRRSKQQPK